MNADRILYDEIHTDLLTHYKTVGRLSRRNPGPLRSLQDVERRMEHVLEHFRGWRVISITESAIEQYISKRLSEKRPDRETLVQPSTVNRELSQLGAALRLAARRKKLGAVPQISMLGESQPRQGFVEAPAFEAIVAHLGAGAALAAWIAFEVAWRIKSEVLTMEWSRVDLDEGRIVLDEEHSKTDKRRVAYLSAATTALLREQHRRVHELERKLGRVIREVFVHLEGHLEGRRVGEFRIQWRNATRKAGCPNIVLHDLRRSGVRALVRSGVPESVAMRISGHTTSSIFKRYDITSEQDLMDARDLRAHLSTPKRPQPLALVGARSRLDQQVANK